MKSRQLLTCLASGEGFSAAELMRACAMTAEELAQTLARIDALGVSVKGDPGAGYRLEGALDLLVPERIIACCGDAARLLTALEIELEVGSTNDVLSARSQCDNVHGVALLAERQTLGRGRQGRPWVSPFARNLYLTLGWSFTGGLRKLQGLSLAVGAGIADAMARQFGCDIALKWPNDLYLAGRKCGGILIETTGDPAGSCTALIGIGLNVDMPEMAAAEIDQPWTDIRRQASVPPGRNEVAGVVIGAVLPLLEEFEVSGFGAWQARWASRDFLRGQRLEISGSTPIVGIGCGVNEEGALLVQHQGRIEAVYGGDATLSGRRVRRLPAATEADV